MKLLGQAVNHEKFGKGVITEFADQKITVNFGESQRLFLFPDVFSKHLIMKDLSMRKKIDQLNGVRLQEIEKKKQGIKRENRQRSRIYAMKIPEKSQLAFDISEENLGERFFVDSGSYLSGKMMGKPRIPTNIQPNSAILLTNCKQGAEDDRCIIGIAMVEEYFWGKECKDGKIRLHRKHNIMLAPENRISFWKYFKREAFPEQWGRVPFRYFQNHAMQNIIYNLSQKAEGSEQEEDLKNLYQYFCTINRLAEQ